MNNDIVNYINKQPPAQQKILQKIRKLIIKIAPSATESMSYGAPTFKYHGKSILYAAFKSHVGLYPEPDTIKAFNQELEKYETSKGTIKFSLDKPIPYSLIEKIIRYKYQL